MNEEQPSYKVTDRRLFNSDGSPREVPPEEQPEPKPQPTPPTPQATPIVAETLAGDEAASGDVSSASEATVSTAAESPAVASQTQSPSQDQQNEEAEAADAEGELPGADDPASFASFMMSIASNAASSLGMMEHPVTHKREVDLELGKHWIDVLGMLQQKTRGNLLPQEQQILESLLADLRMQYVSLTHAAPQKAQTFSSRDIVGG